MAVIHQFHQNHLNHHLEIIRKTEKETSVPCHLNFLNFKPDEKSRKRSAEARVRYKLTIFDQTRPQIIRLISFENGFYFFSSKLTTYKERLQKKREIGGEFKHFQ